MVRRGLYTQTPRREGEERVLDDYIEERKDTVESSCLIVRSLGAR